MKDKIRAWIERRALTAPGTRIVCAVSGGADSMCMLHVLRELAPALGVTVEAAHFDHRLRGAESDGDRLFVQEQCRRLGVPLHSGSGDVRARARRTGESLEEAARVLRYEFLEQFAPCVATAHTMDDNLETVLLNLTRGTGLRGLCGIPARRGIFIRPMLPVTRAEIEAYLEQEGIPFRTDSSNRTPDMRRNRIRQRVIPLLREENPSLAQTVFRMTQVLGSEDDYLTRQAQTLLRAASVEGGYDCAVLRAADAPLRMRAVQELLRGAGVPKLSEQHILASDRLIRLGGPSARLRLPGGLCARREYGLFRVERASLENPSFSPVKLVPGAAAELPSLGLRVVCEAAEQITDVQNTPSTFFVKCDTIDYTTPILIRPRQPGDAMRLPGGARSLKRLMIDRKLPAAVRGSVPVAADDRGVIGVYGIGINLDRSAQPGGAAVVIKFQNLRKKEDTSDD